MNTGKIITAIRDKKGWSQADLADNSGVSRVIIGKYERGEAAPSIEFAKRIADAFGVSLDYLVYRQFNLETLSYLCIDKFNTGCSNPLS